MNQQQSAKNDSPSPLILAISQSTAHCSCVIASDSKTIAIQEWDSKMINNHKIFEALPHLLKEASVAPQDIDFFAVDTGPGSFAGIRTAISTLNGLAIPSNKPVIGISCGEAIAYDILRESPKTNVLVVGDARRQRLWHALFSRSETSIETKVDYSLTTNEEFPALIESDTILATPDWERLADYLKDSIPSHATLIERQSTPRAETIAELAALKARGQIDPKPVQPVYMHPPVQHHTKS